MLRRWWATLFDEGLLGRVGGERCRTMRAEAATFCGRVSNEDAWRQIGFLACVQPEGSHFGRREGCDTRHLKKA